MPQPERSPARTATIHRLKVTLKYTKPPIWRRIEVPSNITLGDLHGILQVIMDWWEEHLHDFEAGGRRYGDPDLLVDSDVVDEYKTKLSQIAPGVRSKFIYEYDFGDSWDHEILVEAVKPPEPGVRYPICVAGKRAAPLEDSGGVWGYERLVEVLNDPEDPEHEDMLEWAGGPIDPEAFDLDAINQRLEVFREGATARGYRDDRSLRPGAE